MDYTLYDCVCCCAIVHKYYIDTAVLASTCYSSIFFLNHFDFEFKQFLLVVSATLPCSLSCCWIKHWCKLDCFKKQMDVVKRNKFLCWYGTFPKMPLENIFKTVQYQQQSRRTVNGKMYAKMHAESAKI